MRPHRKAGRTRVTRRRRASAAAFVLGALALGQLSWPNVQCAYSGSTSDAGNTWTAGACYPQQLFGNPGFETGTAAPWTTTGSTTINNSTVTGLEAPHSGLWDAWINLISSLRTGTITQTVSSPAGCTNLTLSFWLHMDQSSGLGGASLAVQLLTSTGSVYSTVATFNNTSTSGYTQYSYNISSAIGKFTAVRFSGTSTGIRTVNYVLDDTALTFS